MCLVKKTDDDILSARLTTCQEDVAKNIWARVLKLGELTGDDDHLINFLKKSDYFVSVMLLFNSGILYGQA